MSPRKQKQIEVTISLFSKHVIESYNISTAYFTTCTNNPGTILEM